MCTRMTITNTAYQQHIHGEETVSTHLKLHKRTDVHLNWHSTILKNYTKHQLDSRVGAQRGRRRGSVLRSPGKHGGPTAVAAVVEMWCPPPYPNPPALQPSTYTAGQKLALLDDSSGDPTPRKIFLEFSRCVVGVSAEWRTCHKTRTRLSNSA